MISNGHAVDRIAHEITDAEAHRVTLALAAQGIRVRPATDVDRVLHLWALAPVSTKQEVKAIAAFRLVTDSRLAWHEAVAS